MRFLFLLSLLVVLLSSAYGMKCPYMSAKAKSADKDSLSYATIEQPSLQSTDPMVTLNKYTADYYDINRMNMVNTQMQSPMLPMIVVSDHLELYIKTTTSAPTAVSPKFDHMFHQLKLLSHPTLATFVMVQPAMSSSPITPGIYKLTDENVQQIRDYLATYEGTDSTILTRNFTAAQVARNQRIYKNTLSYLQRLVQEQKVVESELIAFGESIRADILDNIADSGKSCLDIVHKQMMTWKQQYFANDDAAWNRLRVLVLAGSHMARNGQMMMQYFSRLLNSPIDGEARVMYAEANEVDNNGFPLLSIHLIDFHVGQYLTGDPLFMHSDVLAQSTKQYLDIILNGYNDPNAPQTDSTGFSRTKVGIIVAITIAVSFLLGSGITYYCVKRKFENAQADMRYTTLDAGF